MKEYSKKHSWWFKIKKYTLQAIIIFDFRLLTETQYQNGNYTQNTTILLSFLKQWILYYKAAYISPYLTKPDYDYRMQSFKSSWGISMYQYFVVFTTIFHFNCCLPTVLKNRASTESSFISLQNCSQWLYIPSDVPNNHISILVKCLLLSQSIYLAHILKAYSHPTPSKQFILIQPASDSWCLSTQSAHFGSLLNR